MGERKGQNKYYPPDYDPKKGGLNKWQGTHALRERARKLHLGILIIRFEMPFNVWCLGCENHVGMGVRYNAEKTKAGSYYTTPIYEFKMKCHLCSNYFIIRTDPKNFDYELVEGLRRQEKRWDMTENEQVASMERDKAKKLATDAMYKLEHVETDIAKSRDLDPRMKRLEQIQYRLKDDFARNQELRRKFRTTKKEVAERLKEDTALLKKASLDITLLPEADEDRRLASMIAQYKTVKNSEEQQKEIINKLDDRSIFEHHAPSTSKTITDCLVRGSFKRRSGSLELIKQSVKSSIVKQKLAKLDSDTVDGSTLVKKKHFNERATKCSTASENCDRSKSNGLSNICAAYGTSSGDDD